MTEKKWVRWGLAALTAVFAVTGFVLRFLQLKHELLGNGMLAKGSYLHIVLTVLSFVLFFALAALLLPLKKEPSHRPFFTRAAAPNALQLLAGGGIFVGNLLLYFSKEPVRVIATQSPAVMHALQSLLVPLGLICAVCVAAFAVFCLLGKRPPAPLYMLASLYLVIRLIVCFQAWNTDPSVHDYAFQLFAAICCMIAAFQFAGFCFERGKRRLTLFWSLSATVFCAMTFADHLSGGTNADLIVNLSLLILMMTFSAQLLFPNRLVLAQAEEERSAAQEAQAGEAEPEKSEPEA